MIDRIGILRVLGARFLSVDARGVWLRAFPDLHRFLLSRPFPHFVRGAFSAHHGLR